uniref:Regulatory protein zeste n=1 Tax=Bactrocera latifrons TaxID=174628 RepID=A0A0K8UMS0_BACLA
MVNKQYTATDLEAFMKLAVNWQNSNHNLLEGVDIKGEMQQYMNSPAMNMYKKRERTQNWNHQEKKFLLDLCRKDMRIIENKRLDAGLTAVKNKAWKIIHQKFSSQFGTDRTCNRLKEQWRRMKACTRNEILDYNNRLARFGAEVADRKKPSPFTFEVWEFMQEAKKACKSEALDGIDYSKIPLALEEDYEYREDEQNGEDDHDMDDSRTPPQELCDVDIKEETNETFNDTNTHNDSMALGERLSSSSPNLSRLGAHHDLERVSLHSPAGNMATASELANTSYLSQNGASGGAAVGGSAGDMGAFQPAFNMSNISATLEALNALRTGQFPSAAAAAAAAAVAVQQQQPQPPPPPQPQVVQIASAAPQYQQQFQLSPGIQGIVVNKPATATATQPQQIILQNGQIIQPMNLIGQQLIVPTGLVMAPDTTLLQIQNVGACGPSILTTTPQGTTMMLRTPSPQNKQFISPTATGQQFIVGSNGQLSPIGQIYSTPMGLVMPTAQQQAGTATYVQQNATIQVQQHPQAQQQQQQQSQPQVQVQQHVAAQQQQQHHHHVAIQPATAAMQQQQQQQHQQTQMQSHQETQQYSSQQQFSSVQQQQRISRTEQRTVQSQQVTQQRVQHVGAGGAYTPPALTHVYGQGDISPPIFEQIFKNARFAQGGNALFEGKLRGNPKPFVSWTRKGAPLLESQKFRMSYNEATGEVSLLINQIGPGDEGEYTCTARNQYGEAICSVYIQPEGAAMPVLQPVQKFEKSLYTNGYSYTSVEEEFRVDTFEYRLLREVQYREAITRRSAYELDQYLTQELDRTMGPAHAPQISQKPRNSKLIEGSDAVFSAKVGSNPKPRLTWFHNGQRLVASQKYETTYSSGIATLRVKNATYQDAGHYTLLAENTQGCVVSSAVLAVEPAAETTHEPKPVDATAEQLEAGKALPPTFVKGYTDREVTEGRMTRFDCRVTGNPYPEVIWLINGRPVKDDVSHKILVNESGSHSLMITSVSRLDSGAVQCLARNKAGDVAIEAQLNVLEKEQVVAPQFVQRFSTMTVREGEPITMSANAIGTPVPRITWQKDGVQINSTAERYIGIDGGATCLEIPRVKATDAGWYQCTAQNIAGSSANRARLYVEVPREQPTPEQRRLNLPRPTKVIEPEPVPGPEIIYLRHVERAKPHLRPGEEDRVYPPPQFIIPLQNVQQVEGNRVHMEARIEPVGDPTMVVEWYLNGQPLAASSRATSVFKFGFIALDLLSIMTHDSGEYMCRVTNAAGVAESRAILSVIQRPSIEQSSQNPNSLQYINQLEDYSRYQRQESSEELMKQAPVFIRPLRDLGDFEEGKNVHFEAQVTPVNDPTMRVEWYKDGRPITASSRITAIFNFGYVSLNILHLRAEDAGSYTVRAVNRVGEATSTSNIRVNIRSEVTADLGIPEQQRYIEKVEELEDYRKSQQRRHVQEVPEPIAPPQFKSPIQNQLDIREGAHAHFEARLEPIGDATMRVEWLKDGQPLEASSRSTTFFNFGYVALTIKQLTIYDAGTYTCRAYNAIGQDTTTAQLTVLSKKDIVSDSQHPGGLEKLQHLEDSARYGRTEEEETKVTQIPRFLGPMKGTNKILEGQRAHFEARVEPQSDLSLQIEWYHNGRAISAATRIQTYHDFGYVALDISQVRAEDAGVYTVVARNKLGEAQLQGTMVVETRSSIDTSSMHRGLYEKTQNLENKPFVEPHYDIEEISKSKPIFVQPLSDHKPIHEGKNIHLECRLEPMGDPTMRVEWFHNGRPITVGSRFRTYYDFGFVALDIVQAIAADSGEYTCRATNHLGSAHTSSCVRIIDRSDVVTETQNEMSLEQIHQLEDSTRRRHHVEEDITIMQAPQFTRPLHNIETVEGTNVHLECRLQPVGDPSMRVEWFVNGKPVKTGHRFRPAYEFDYVALDLLGCYAVDSGVYTCQARNQLGEAVTSCSVRIIAKSDLILETQNESGLQKIAYLEDSSRYRRSEFVDEIVNVRPRFLTHPKSLTNTREGGHAHFECKIEPVTDPNLKVEWFKNGRPITVGHRFRPIHDFGYVALDIVDLISEDSGIYTCRAVNLIGSDETRVELQCRSSEQIVTVTQNEAGLEQIHYLEDRSRYSRREEIDETTKQAPVFTTSLKNVEIKENQRAHFECRLIPVSDPTMRVEWYHNNLPLKSGSRFTETNNFGFVALDIMSCLPEDAGTYTCRAFNAVGEAITSAVAIVHTKKSIYLESQHESALPRLQHLEDGAKRQRISVQEEVVNQAPVFTLPVRDVRVAEGQAVHFEARLIPVGDPHLKVEWLRNGQPIEASNRTTTMHDFGYVAFNMKYVNPEDSGTYTCRAVNELGQAVTSASLIVQSKTSIQLETQHEAAMHKIHQLEDHSRYQRREEEEYVVSQPPRFVTKLIGPTNLVEGQSAHYECRIEPYPDPNLKVEWFHNGKALSTGHRFRTTYDFGFAALDILTVYAEDSGEYTCRVTNNLGEAVNSINLNVQSRSGIIRETQHEEALQKIQHLEDESRYQRKVEEDQFLAERPQFGRPLRNANVNEGTPVHLEATLTPVNDPTMKVEWYCNGTPIQTGHRFKTTYDFGFVALDILYTHAEDTGTYMCKAKNAVGEAVTTCAVNVTANKTLDLDTMDAQRLEKIRQLENYAPPTKAVVEEKGQKPIFLTPLSNLEHLKEGEHAHLECRVEPINDPNLKIEWFCNGKQLPTGHRFRTTHDFGYVALDILYVYGEDTGTYMCKATNLLGEAVNTCNVRILNRRSMILDTQHPDALEKIQKLESKSAPARTEPGDLPIGPPHFTVELRGTTEIFEGQTAHFEAQVAPVHDPNLRIEFYHNGKPLPSASRFHITFDFGYVSLDITHAVPEDAGEYSVRAINNLGQCVSSTSLKVNARGTIISESQHPEGLEKIRKLESNAPFQRPEVETPGTRQRPVFTQPLQNIDRINEHQTAHFECRLIPVGDPNLKVEWYRNEKIIEDSSRITKQHDFGFVSLDISHIRKEDEGVYMCRAVNPLGEAVTTASMRVVSEASIQMDTQHPDSISRIHQLERPSAPRAEEPERAFEKPIFTQLLTGPSELWEGQHAHFEARVVPVGDPSLKFEWYINGVELQMGSRLRTTHDFGFVTLDINAVVPEDAGVYMCRAYNAAGEAVSSTAMKVKTKSNIAGEPLIPESWEAIRLKEAAMNRVPEMFVDTTPQQAPVFTTHLQSYDKLSEGQHVLLEAQVEPRADPNLRIEWFKNGISLTTGSRIRSTFDFGLVTLSVNGLRSDDSAIYTCKATNQIGEAVSTCSLKIEDRHWLQGESLHPDSLPRIGELEAPKPGRPEAPEPVYEVPVFITHLNNIECKEGDNVRFESMVEPSRDPTMQIEWSYNGQPLQAAAKFKSIYDFGYCALDLSNTYPENSGVYTLKATNSKGSATTSGTLKCTGGKTFYLDTQHPQGEAGLEAVRETEEELANRYSRQVSKPETQYPAPVWTKPLQAEFHLSEAQALHLEGNVEPKEDPNLFIEWYFNGKILQHGSRFKMTSEFGFVTMDLTEVYERDQGIYTCKAYNKAGEAFTTTTIFCTSKESIIEKTQHPKGAEGLEQIQDLEESLRKDGTKPEKPEEGMAPRFTTEFIDIKDVGEGEIAHYEANLVPTGDQSMVIEWFYNGKVLEASHRVRTIYAFGMVALEILGTKIEDSGTYTCRATNKYGSAEISCVLECVEKPRGQKPRFTSHIQSLEGLKDGQSAHFECTLIPVNDPELKVEWYHNGKLLRHSNRIKTVSDFGYVVLDIAYLQDHDSGEYMCRAYNKYGEDFTRATLNCGGRGGVFYDSLQPDSLPRIRELECPQGQQADTGAPVVTEPPKFITQIADITKLVEGQSAHFEARLTPVTDPDLKVEWYFNGKKLPHGHRFRTFHDFGIVILDILYCYEENSGVYECRAVNKYGEDVTRATLKCTSKANLILDSQLPRGMEGGLEKIANLEYSMVRTRDETVEETKGKAPVFTVPLENIDNMREGENAHFEARVTPTDDPRLRVEWFWNGRPLKAGSRFRTFCDFGFVILEISPVYPEDSGEYSCRAINEYGEAVTTATMKIQGKRSIIMESQLPKGMEGTIDRIAELEGLGGRSTEFVPEDDSGKPPEFITTPFDMVITENSLAHFECRLQPVNDPSMRVDWFHNGKALWAGSRIKTINDFGFVILEIAGCYQRDTGLYTCKATNKHGEATVSCKLQVKGRQGIIVEPQLPSNFRTGTESLQKLEESMHKREEIIIDEEQPNPPKFIEEIKDNLDVPEGGPIHFDCRVEPVGDPTMRIDWFYNGRPMPTGSRVHQLNDFGFIAMDIDYIYIRDAGEYTCRATNKWGTATTTAKVTCKSKHSIVYDTQLPDGMTAEKLKELERGRIPDVPRIEEPDFGPPEFITEIQNVTAEESEPMRFECQVEPKTDPNLRVEWYRNGKLLPSGHRYRTIFDMGYVSLDILYVYAEDSGEYVCRAVNKHGEARTKATISCKKLPTIMLQNQVPRGMKPNETLTQMEATIKKYTSEVHLTEDDLFDPDRKQPPRFVTQIKDQTTLTEMAKTKFECQLAPVGDPNMKVEWFFNGKPLLYKNRFQPIYDFGYVAMNFGWVYPEDSGEYVCRATNLYGKDETRAIIKISGKPGIVYDSQLPAHMQETSIQRIREMEASWQVVPEEVDPDAKPRTKPTFVSKLEPQTVEEGEPARFCVRVTGHPRPRVMWLINGHTVVHGSRYKLTNDGMFHLDIPKTRQYDTGKVEVIARNSVGESIATTELNVVERSDDYRGVLKNSPRPWYDYELTAYQKERQETELEKIFDERKQYLADQGKPLKGVEHLKPKQLKPETPEWQQTVNAKRSEDYYSKLQELETEQLLKETNLRKETHQYAIPGEKVVQSSAAKGMAKSYEENLEEQSTTTTTAAAKKIVNKPPVEPAESSVHGREVFMNKQQQTQKEVVGDLEITRKITATETTEMEHKGTVQERVVKGPVQPSKPPVFTKKIQPCRVFENEQAKFEVEFDGEPMPTVKWYRENFPIKNSPDLQIHTFSGKSILIIRQVFVEDSAVFSCIAENRGGTAKCSANLVVEERRRAGKGGLTPPSFVNVIQSTTVATGQLARFDAKVTGSRPMDVYWLKNGQKVQPSIKFKMLEEDNVYTLLIIEPFAEDSGRYECVAVNVAGEARCDADCIVQSPTKPDKPTTPGSEKPPHIVEKLKSQSVEEGSKVIFRCRIEGKPTPTARWLRGENIVKPSRYFQMTRQGEYYQLVVSEAFPEDEGTYKCVAENKLGSIQTSAQLKVRPIENLDAPPTITALKDVSVSEGMPAQFKTTVTGKVKATSVQWFREGSLIPETPDFQMIFDGNSAVLLIGTTYEEDSGIFTVRVTSSTGQVESSAKLTVKSKD